MMHTGKGMTEKPYNIDGISDEFLTNLKGFLGKKLRFLELQEEVGDSKNLARSSPPYFLINWFQKKKRSCYISEEDSVLGEPSFTSTTTTDTDDELLAIAETLLLLKGAEITSAEEVKTTFNFNPLSVIITPSDIIPTKKQRKRYSEFEAWGGGKEVEFIRPIKKKKVATTCSQVDPTLPEEFKIRIRELIRSNGGPESEAVVFVYEKKLFKSDVKRGENRFLMPLKQLNNEFLTEEEKRWLRTPDEVTRKPSKIEALLIQPCLKECKVNLKKWDMGDKASRKLNENYVLVTTWNQIVETNKLDVGTIVQLWSFRTGEGQLCFALVKKEV